MYCTNCGEKNDDKSKYCYNCGQLLEVKNKLLNDTTKEESSVCLSKEIKEDSPSQLSKEIKEDSPNKIGKNYKVTLAVMVGENSEYYLSEFEKIEQGESPKFNPMVLLSGIWMPYRKMNREIYLTLIPIIGWFYAVYLGISNLFIGNKRYYYAILKKLEKNGLSGIDLEADKSIEDKLKILGGTSITNVCLYMGSSMLIGIIIVSLIMMSFFTFIRNADFIGEVAQVQTNAVQTLDYSKLLDYPFPNTHEVFGYLDSTGVAYVDAYDEEAFRGTVYIENEDSMGSFDYEHTGKTIVINRIDILAGSTFNGIIIEGNIQTMKEKLGEPNYEGTGTESGYYGLSYITSYGSVWVESIGFDSNDRVGNMIIYLDEPF